MPQDFDKPFADTGDRQDIPADAQSDNTLSWDKGFTLKYSIIPQQEGGEFIPRKSFNQIIYMISSKILGLLQDFKGTKISFATAEALESIKIGANPKTPNITLNATGDSTIATPDAEAEGKQIVNAEWVRNYADKVDLKVGAGYKKYTAIINLTNSETPNNCISLADDAQGKSLDELRAFIGHYPCLFINGEENRKLNPDNYAKYADDNTDADITTLGNDVMVKFPRRGLSIRTIGSEIYITFTDDPNAKDFNYYAFQKGLLDKEAFFYGAYKGYVSGSKLYSSSGKTPTVNTTIGAFRNYAQARGSGYEQVAFYQRQYLIACYILLHQSLNSAEKIGRGKDSGSAVIATGGSNTWGMDSELAKAQYPTYLTDGAHNVKCLGIEDLWGNCWEWLDGCVTQNYNVATATSGFNDTGKGYVSRGIASYNAWGGTYISAIAGNNELGFYPTSAIGSDTTYFCDGHWQGANCIATAGGSWSNGALCGVFTLLVNDAPSTASSDRGARLMFL